MQESRHAEYRRWIVEHDHLNAPGMCKVQSEAMMAEFPELRLMRGHYHCVTPMGRHEVQHWWCVAPDDTEIDPTAKQFEGTLCGTYVPYFGPNPLGRCMDCGSMVWENKGFGGSFCDEICHNRYEEWLGEETVDLRMLGE